jgi:hypothetical protein
VQNGPKRLVDARRDMWTKRLHCPALASSESVLKPGQWLILRMRRLAMAMWVMASETSMRAS